MTDTEQAIAKIAELLGGTAIHVNRGEVEDYVRGFNDGYDDAEANVAPDYDAVRNSYERGYEQGYASFMEQMAD